jgi:hypothetical protein
MNPMVEYIYNETNPTMYLVVVIVVVIVDRQTTFVDRPASCDTNMVYMTLDLKMVDYERRPFHLQGPRT